MRAGTARPGRSGARVAPVALAAWLLAVWFLAAGLSCGTMVESSVTGSTRTDGGLMCNLNDPCNCTACGSTDECAEGLSCVPARGRGQACPGALRVCGTEP